MHSPGWISQKYGWINCGLHDDYEQRVRGRVTDEKTGSLPSSPQSSVTKSMWLPIFINLGPIFIAQFHFSFCLYFIILVVNWRLEIGLSKIPMKLLKIVWHCRRLYQFILVNCCDPMLAFRLLKIGVRLSKILIISMKIGLHCTRLGFFLLFQLKLPVIINIFINSQCLCLSLCGAFCG